MPGDLDAEDLTSSLESSTLHYEILSWINLLDPLCASFFAHKIITPAFEDGCKDQ